jgi:predicted RNA-binding protein with PUA-like domain
LKSYWLVKSEADCYSIDQFEKDSKKLAQKKQGVPWTGIRNYQARNFMRDKMSDGDRVLFYHSSQEPMGVVGCAKVVGKPHADMTAFDKNDEHFDPKSKKESPTWICVDLTFDHKFKNIVTLAQIKFDPELKGIVLAQQGSRLSVQPVSEAHFKRILILGKK